MAIEIRSDRIVIPSGTGLRAVDHTYQVDRLPRACWVAMTGYQVRYDESDHHVQTLQVELSCGMGTGELGPAVYVTARLLLRDDNGDDPFSGWVEFVLFTDSSPVRADTSTLNVGGTRWSS